MGINIFAVVDDDTNVAPIINHLNNPKVSRGRWAWCDVFKGRLPNVGKPGCTTLPWALALTDTERPWYVVNRKLKVLTTSPANWHRVLADAAGTGALLLFIKAR